MDTIKDVHNVNIKENRCLKTGPYDFWGELLIMELEQLFNCATTIVIILIYHPTRERNNIS